MTKAPYAGNITTLISPDRGTYFTNNSSSFTPWKPRDISRKYQTNVLLLDDKAKLVIGFFTWYSPKDFYLDRDFLVFIR